MRNNFNKQSTILSFLFFSVVALNTVQAEIKSSVDALILEHAQMWNDVADGPTVTERELKIGVQEQVTDNAGIRHVVEVVELLNDTSPGGGAELLEACCWRPQPAISSTYVIGSVQQVLNAGTAPPNPEDLYNPGDRADLLTVPADQGRAGFPVPLIWVVVKDKGKSKKYGCFNS